MTRPPLDAAEPKTVTRRPAAPAPTPPPTGRRSGVGMRRVLDPHTGKAARHPWADRLAALRDGTPADDVPELIRWTIPPGERPEPVHRVSARTWLRQRRNLTEGAVFIARGRPGRRALAGKARIRARKAERRRPVSVRAADWLARHPEAAAEPRGYITEHDIAEGAGFARHEATA